MLFKRILSLSMLLALAGGAFVASEQNAEAGRCCRQRCHRRCCNGNGYGYGNTYAYSGNYNTGNCGTGNCSSGNCNVGTPAMNQGTYNGNAPAPAAPAPPPAPST